MNREIKFRVWNNETARYLHDGHFIIFDNCVYDAKTSGYDNEPMWLGEEFENAIIEQFTGLTDKNGVDIYEGDIIKLQWEHKTWIEPVVFDCGGFYPFTDTCGQYADPWEVSAIGHGNYEVIGNIHEHKHLLED